MLETRPRVLTVEEVAERVTHYSHDADKVFARLDRNTRRRVGERLRVLESDPYDLRISKPLRRDLNGLRYVLAIGPRGRVYRDL